MLVHKPTHSQFDTLDHFFNLFTNNFCYELFDDVKQSVKDDKLELTIDLPGVKRDEIKLTIQGHLLKLEAERKKRKIERILTVSDVYDMSTIDAKLEDGVLTIMIDRHKNSKLTEVKIR